MIEPCPFKVGDLVRVKSTTDSPPHAGSVGTVVTVVRIYNSPREMKLGAPYRDDIQVIGYNPDTDMDHLRQKIIGVKFWSDPSKEYHIEPKDLEKVEP